MTSHSSRKALRTSQSPAETEFFQATNPILGKFAGFFLEPGIIHPASKRLIRRIMTWHIAVTGSSPRVRGTRCGPTVGCRRGRFIPARAGNSPPIVGQSLIPTVHPRACGELGCIGTPRHRILGSSPRVRGTRPPGQRSSAQRRFIPARAGNSEPQAQTGKGWPVHPRACGELASRSNAAPSITGSSPRVRGTRHLQGDNRHRGRFIPARAGNSQRPFPGR